MNKKSPSQLVFLVAGLTGAVLLCVFALHPVLSLSQPRVHSILLWGGLITAGLLSLFFFPARIAQNALLVLGSLLLPLALLEVVLGFRPDLFVGGSLASHYLTPKAYLRYVQLTNPNSWQALEDKKQRFDISGLYYHYKPGILVPGTGTGAPLTMDEIGFHNPPGTYSRNDHIPYIFLGDSGTIGIEVEKPFSQIVSEITREPTLNIGIGGQSPQDYATALERYGLAKKPRVVVVSLFLNDVSDALTYDRLDKAGLDDALYYFVDAEAYPAKGPVGFLFNRLCLPRYLAAMALFGPPWGHGAKSDGPITGVGTTQDTAMVSFPVSDGAKTVSVPAASVQTELVTSRLTDAEMAPTLAALVRIKTMAESVGAKVLVTYLPQPIEYYRPFLTEGGKHFASVPDQDFGWGKQLQAYVESIGLPFLDPRPWMRSHVAHAPYLFPHINDAHLNTVGHALFGRMLAEYIGKFEANTPSGVEPMPAN